MKIRNQTFNNETIDLDYNEYFDCAFQECTLVYHGGRLPSIENCSFSDSTVTFADNAANTLSFMNALYHGGFQSIIENTFNHIRSNNGNMTWTIN